MAINKRILIPTLSILAGVPIILCISTCYEGPLLLYINEQHAVRLMDALGLILAVPSWLYLNFMLYEWWAKKGKD